MKQLSIVCASLLITSISQAAPLIYNTGVDANGVSKADNAIDSHYTILGHPQAYVVDSTGGYPIPPWISDSSVSAWISPTLDTTEAPIVFTYRTTFSLTPAQAASFSLSGRWSMDDFGLGIDLNGNATGNVANDFTNWTPFSINSGFVAGLNTLDFRVWNSGGGPTGLRVEYTNVPNANVPDSGSSAALAGVVLIGLALFRKSVS